jgi:hypothetical protein
VNVRLEWRTSLSASCLHAAACLAEGRPAADPAWQAALEPCVADLRQELAAAGLDPLAALRELICQAVDFERPPELVARAWTRLRGAVEPRDPRVLAVAGKLADVRREFLRLRPQVEEELAVRGRPLREQWEARGPGLCRQLTRLVDDALLPEQAQVVLAVPYVGGHGRACVRSNRCLIEAVLYHPVPELPEPLRLAWCLAQLQGDLPRFAESLPPGSAARIGALATVPAVLAAGEAVEWVGLSSETLAAAIRAWHGAAPPEVGEILGAWWETYVEGPASWPVALGALAAMLEPLGSWPDP